MSAHSTLRGNPLFAALDDAELSALASRSVSRSFPASVNLFSEGEPCQGLYIVVSGRVRVFKTSPAGREQVLAIEGRRRVDRRTAGVRWRALSGVGGDCRTIRGSLRAVQRPRASVGASGSRAQAAAGGGGAAAAAVGIIEELSFTMVRDRLISSLLREAQAHGRVTAKGVEFSLGASH